MQKEWLPICVCVCVMCIVAFKKGNMVTNFIYEYTRICIHVARKIDPCANFMLILKRLFSRFFSKFWFTWEL